MNYSRPHSHPHSINWFFSLFIRLHFLAAESRQGNDKENISFNATNNSRAIVAVSIVQKPPVASRPTLLKNVLKSSQSTAALKMPVNSAPKGGALDHTKSASVNQLHSKKSQTIGQRQYAYAEIQKKRKDLLIQKLKEQEDKAMKFTFQANPAPKFKSVPVPIKPKQIPSEKKLVKHNSLPQIPISRKASKEHTGPVPAVPSCYDPERLKYMNDKRKMLAEKYQETWVQFKAKPAAVLKKQPFQPVHNHTKAVDPKPFKLQLTERLFQRGEYNKKLSESNAIRKQQEESRQRQQALEDRKLIRQKTEFRARANPFRSFH